MAGFKAVAERDAEQGVVEHPTATRQTSEEVSQSLQLLLMALGALGKRTIVALANCFTILTVGSAFWLWMMAPPEPSVTQIVSLSIYAAFVLAINFITKRA